MPKVAQLLEQAAALAEDTAQLDAELLLSAALRKPRTYLIAWPDAEVPASAAQRFRGWLAQRAQGMPIAYLLGHREFWSLPLAVDARSLIPRPDTELLVEHALSLPLPDDAAVLDLGTGSGAIALALASERGGWRITATDRSADALTLAGENARALGLRVEWRRGDWYAAVAHRRFALIVSNPPYLADNDEHLHTGDLRFEPRAALVAGPSGLEDLREIVAGATEHLEPGGWLLLEHGWSQGPAVRALVEAAGFTGIETIRDLAGRERATRACLALAPASHTQTAGI